MKGFPLHPPYPTSFFTLILLRRRSTGYQWLLPSLLPSPRPPPLPAEAEADPCRGPRTPPPHCWLHLLLQPLFRSLGPAEGWGAVGVQEAEVVAEEDYGVCWSSTQSEMGVDGESGWRVVMTSQTVGRLPALSRPAKMTQRQTTTETANQSSGMHYEEGQRLKQDEGKEQRCEV